MIAPAFVFLQLEQARLILGTGGITQNAPSQQALTTAAVTLGVAQTWTLASGAGALVFDAGLNTDGFSLGINAAATGGNGNVVGGILGGGGALAKNGADTLSLTGNSIYTGATTINAGVLQIGNGGTRGSVGMGNIVNNAALAFNRSDAFTVGNTISGTGSLTKLGAGTLTITATNTYTGGTTVGAGRLVASNNGRAVSAGPVNIAAGAALELSNPTAGILVS